MRICFVGSPPFGTPILERLAASRFSPALVVTPPARARGRGRKCAPQLLAEKARGLGLDVAQPTSVRDPEFFRQLEALAPDCILVASYGEFLRKQFLELPRLAALNVHPSLLPRHRGATPIPATILAGDEVSGVSIQRIAMELDAGDILLARETPIEPGETAGEMTLRLAEFSGELCIEALERLASGSAVFMPQDPDDVTFCKKLEKADGFLDWTRPAVELERRIRAFNPWPGAHTTLPSGKGLSIWRARAIVRGANVDPKTPGTVVEGEGGIVVTSGDGALVLEEVQAAGKRAMTATEFLRGSRVSPGDRLGLGKEAP